MKLSEALHEGRKGVKRQITGNYFELSENKEVCACVLGTIALGAGYKSPIPTMPGYGLGTFLDTTFPQLEMQSPHTSLGHELVDLNDEKKLTFDELEAWLKERGE